MHEGKIHSMLSLQGLDRLDPSNIQSKQAFMPPSSHMPNPRSLSVHFLLLAKLHLSIRLSVEEEEVCAVPNDISLLGPSIVTSYISIPRTPDSDSRAAVGQCFHQQRFSGFTLVSR